MVLRGMARLAFFMLAVGVFIGVKNLPTPPETETAIAINPPIKNPGNHSPRANAFAAHEVQPNTGGQSALAAASHQAPVSYSLTPTTTAKLGLDTEALAEDEHVFYAMAAPNDPLYPQWYLSIISAPEAWDVSTGLTTTLVAVIDTGFALGHEDLAAAWFINSGESGLTLSSDPCWSGVAEDKQTNECDDDENGYIDDWRGWDFAGNDNNVQTATNSSSGSSHGTKSAGLIAARSNNSKGTAALNWNAKILPLQALFDSGAGYSTDIAAAIEYAVDMGAAVINLSLGGPDPDSATRAAVQYAHQNGVIVVASSGNCGDGQSVDPCIGFASPGGMAYPALYPEVISVGATTSADERASFSSWGPELTLVAPGSGTIQTPTWTNSNATSAYAATSFGTSFSAPIVSSAVSLLKGLRPNLTADEATAILTTTADKVPSMGTSKRTNQYGWGRLNVAQLLAGLTEYEAQLSKASAQIMYVSETSKPQVSSNRGHTLATGITGSTTVKTYCVADPFEQCTLRVRKVGGSTTIVGTKLLNAQGIAVFQWTKSTKTNGEYEAYVTVNGTASNTETLFIK